MRNSRNLAQAFLGFFVKLFHVVWLPTSESRSFSFWSYSNKKRCGKFLLFRILFFQFEIVISRNVARLWG